jgi:hypothetical protein
MPVMLLPASQAGAASVAAEEGVMASWQSTSASYRLMLAPGLRSIKTSAFDLYTLMGI